jgi:hypothetical protein
VIPENKTIFQVAEECLGTAREILKSKGADNLSDTHTDPEGIAFILRCLADLDITICRHVVALSQEVHTAVARGDLDGVGLASFKLGQVVLAFHARRWKGKAGRKPKVPPEVIKRRWEEIARDSPWLNPIDVLTEEFGLSPATIYRLKK